MKKLSLAALLLAAATLELLGCNTSSAGTKETSNFTSTTTAAANADPNAAPDTVVVYYFHGNRRCHTCVGIQETISSTIQERFGQETASGALTFKEINFEDPANKHFVKEFGLSFSSMVVAANQGQKTLKWENCEKIWPLARDKAALAEYADKSIRTYLAMLNKS